MKAIGIIVLAIFYGVYIGKMILQKRKGIQTDQIARGKKKDKVFYIELIMKIATYAVVLFEVISIFVVKPVLPFGVRIAGVVIAFIGDIIFALAVVTMRDSWRAGIPEKDKTKMVTGGIYKYSGNPAFLGFDLVYVGLVLMFFNIPLLVISVFAMMMLHIQILQEEAYLTKMFGEEYIEYKSRVYRYFGRK